MKHLPTLLATLLLSFLVAACSSDNTGTEPLSGNGIDASLISAVPSAAVTAGGTVAYASTESGISWKYDQENNTLRLLHSNAALRDGAAGLSLRVNLEENIITVVQRQRANEAGALGLYDVAFEIRNLPARAYRMVVIEPYVEKEQRPLTFRLDLVESLSGSVQVERTQQPWGDIATL